jgi:aryl-alcohol dehydrogenase-like predicted oxidoreductase
MKRRNFLEGLVGGLGSSVAFAQQNANSGAGQQNDSAKLLLVDSPGELRGSMLYRPLGRTGETVSAIGLGGSHIAKPQLSESESIRLMHAATDRGITFFDNSWDYNEGRSERRMGMALAQNGSRNKVFLMTKIDGRDKDIASRQIEDSLERLKTDRIDLLQFHEVLRFDDADRIFGPGGAIEAAVAAKQAGKIRFIGFTGHKDPRVHL